MSETEKAIERVRKLNVLQPFGMFELCDVFVLLREHDRLKGELALMPCGHPEVLCQDVGPAYCEMCSQINDNTALLAELARLTTLQDASTHDGDYFAVVWRREGDEWYPARIDLPKRGEMWTPLPTTGREGGRP